MKQYTYKVEQSVFGSYTAEAEYLDKMDYYGWELVSVIGQFNSSFRIYYWRREVAKA